MKLEIEVVFTAGHFHGEEWPPSPTRIFQALIAGTHRGMQRLLHQDVRDEALAWLETLPPPIILAPPARLARAHLTNYVPNNDNSALDHIRAGKHLVCYSFPEASVLTYCWRFSGGSNSRQNAETVAAMAALITYIGRTIDLVFARSRVDEADSAEPSANQQAYHPTIRDGGAWLCPAPGFLALCQRRYPRSVSEEPPNFTNSRQVDYRVDDALPFDVPLGVFEMIRENGRLLAYDPRRLREPAGMVRHSMLQWSRGSPLLSEHYGANRISRLLAGHAAADSSKPAEGGHFAVVPLPSMNSSFTADGWMRRVAVIGYGCRERRDFEFFNDVIKGLQGSALLDNGTPIATLQQTTSRKGLLGLGTSKHWRTLTPIILTGFTRRGRSAERCLARALIQQGFDLQDIASVACFSGPIVPKTARALAYRIDKNDHLSKSPRYHAEIIFKRDVVGPLVLGRGRFTGFGLMLPFEYSSTTQST